MKRISYVKLTTLLVNEARILSDLSYESIKMTDYQLKVDFGIDLDVIKKYQGIDLDCDIYREEVEIDGAIHLYYWVESNQIKEYKAIPMMLVQLYWS